MLKKIYRKFKTVFRINKKNEQYDFNKSNPLGGNGERVDIQFTESLQYDSLDMYQKNHIRRYEFVKKYIGYEDTCGDFACGTGYGTVMLSEKAKMVIGADIDKNVIDIISRRYQENSKVLFLNINLLEIEYKNKFDTIISFETLEHFYEKDMKALLNIFNKALKDDGKLFFSTPYLQEASETAVKMGFHLTFGIDEEKIKKWLSSAGFRIELVLYQNYETHNIEANLLNKDFIICKAVKVSTIA
jgi:2-polyprenyl-3-methyl-5-hydroxy-6-metoxy-1,4-benzoquinol methylase